MKSRLQCALVVLILLFSTAVFAVESTTPGPNSNPDYQQLRHIKIAGDAYEVKNLKLVRDAGTFELHSGIICMLTPVEGMITGAVFRGDGTFTLQSNDPREQNQMRMLTNGPGISEDFEKLVLRFADGTPEELKKSLTTVSTAGCSSDLLEENQKFLRTDLRYNMAARLLQPVLAGKSDGFFFAFFAGKKYGKLGFEVDPLGAYFVHPEEVMLAGFNDTKSGIWYGGHLLSEPRKGWHVAQTNHESGSVRAVSHKIDVTIERSTMLDGTSTETLSSQIDDLRVVPLDLFSKLRVSKVVDGNGIGLSWIQEDHNEDGAYFVVLAKPVKKGEPVVLTTSYNGKGAVSKEGDGNFYPLARASWYPNTHFGEYAMYDVTMHIPKGLTMAATGTMVSQRNEGGENVTEWKSDVPLAVAGFNFGDFKSETEKLEKQGVQVTAFVNKDIPDNFKSILQAAEHYNVALGTMSTTPMLKKSLAEANYSVQLYTDYFGPMSYKNLEVTQQTAGNFGQAWPGLVFLPIFYFLDDTQRHQLNLDHPKGQYWKVVEPHEVSHQWWGHSIGWTGYRDQWMSEGFADFSASLFIEYIRNDRKEYVKFWKDLRDQMTDKDSFGHRPIDVGSVTMGYRVSTSKVGGWTGQNVLYPKGAYILHMIRMMMYNQKTGDTDFKAMMHDLVDTYRNKTLTTEDFKAMVEKHMNAGMNATNNGKMDWFFDEWVYGTEIPTYSMTSTPETGADGKPAITLKITQSGVSPNFRMIVPIYFELDDGKVGKLGAALLVGNQTITEKIPLGTTVPKRLLINYNEDVLSTN